MRRILLIFLNDAKRRLKSPVAILVLMLTPLIMTGIIGAIFSPGAKQYKLPRIKVLIVDKDHNMGSMMFLGAFSSPQLEEMFDITMVNEEQGNKLISDGKASAMIIIPEKFSENVLRAEKSEFIVIKNPSEQFLPNIVEEFMNTYAVIISGFVQAFEPEIREIEQVLDTDFEDIEIIDMVPFMEKGKNKIESMVKYLDPLLIQLKSEITGAKDDEEKAEINIFSYILPGMTIMFLFFIIEIFLRDILSEREDGKLQRMMFAPLRTREIILARIFSGWAMGTAVLLLIVIFGVLIFNISWGNYASLFILSAVTCFWISAFLALLNSFYKNRNQAGAFTAPIILVFAAFGGSLLPVNNLPVSLRWIAQITPNHWFIEGCLKIKEGVFPSLSVSILLISSVLLFIIASILLNRRITV